MLLTPSAISPRTSRGLSNHAALLHRLLPHFPSNLCRSCGRGRRIGDRPWMAVVDRIEGLDIDYPEDFAMAEIIAAGQRLPR